ncbi:TonB-dependent receptor [Nemorincola caseinilytica]|uniref:TonB-dependent receptor n=1 Tax=Nemorincola caseinilytica TaxID=2054315 RepID=A0ABP8NB39_9BACT
MKHLSILLFLVVCCVLPSAAQSYIIKGSVTDTLNNNKLSMASVVLIRTADSVIAAHGRTGNDGRFEVRVKQQGKYFLRIAFPGFAEHIDEVDVKKSTTDLGDLPMISREYLLKEFVLTQQVAAIKIKGDTTEYMADSFKVKEGATVEDLLKRLPGIQVDKNGQIVAQGEAVQKVLVDGEEFFSDDPKVVTRGLQADAVKKVQVYDKKSDQADFTGIDDGEKTRTINLELKEDKKKGYFGKLEAGAGTDGYFQEQAMANAFKAKRQFSVFGIASNTDKAGLGWEDSDKFGNGSGTTEITEDGDFINRFTPDEFSGWDGRYNGEGLPQTWTGGTHYANKWNSGEHHLSANYRYGKQKVNIDGNTDVQYSMPNDSIRVTETHKEQSSSSDRHGFDVMYEWKIDTATSVKITSNAGVKATETRSEYSTDNYFKIKDAPGANLNNLRQITGDGNAQFINTDLILRHRFPKKGRTLAIDAKENYSENTNTGTLFSVISDTFALTPDLVTRQRKDNYSSSLAFSGKATYTEPLSKTVFTEVNYGITVNNSTARNLSFDTLATGQYSDVPNTTFSNDFTYNILSNAGGLSFKFMYKTYNFSFGSDVSRADYVQTDRTNTNNTTTYHFTNLFPRANFTYRFGKQTSFNFNYRGNTKQPTITQMQPFLQNTDPLNITIGNPDLRQEFVNEFNMRFNDYKILQSRFLWASASFSTTSNAISTEQSNDSGINKTRYINVDGNYSGYAFIGYGFKVPKTDLSIGGRLNGSTYHINNIINRQQNSSNTNSISLAPYVSYTKDNKFDIRWEPQIAYNVNTSTNNPVDVTYYIFTNELSGSVQLPKKIEIGSSVDMMFRQKTPIFTTNNNVIKWNAYVTKKFLKKSQLELRASVYDILNQNLGFSRIGQGNMVTQNSYNTIRRYGMLSLIWNFTHTPVGAPPAQDGGTMIIK